MDGVEEELRDFLAADMLDVPVDPAFKERLRRELWEIVQQNAVKLRAANSGSDGRGDPDPDTDTDFGD